MRIDINFQSLAQKLKHKAISNSLRKRKNEFTNAAHNHADLASLRTARACVARRHGPRTKAARGEEACAHWHICKNAHRL